MPTRRAIAPGGLSVTTYMRRNVDVPLRLVGMVEKARNTAPSTPLVHVSSVMLVETGTGKPTANLGNEVTPHKERGKEKGQARVRANPQQRHQPLLCSGFSESWTLQPFQCSGFSEGWAPQPFQC